MWATSQDSVHKPQVLRRRERRAEADRTEVLLLTSQAPYRSATPAHEEAGKPAAFQGRVFGGGSPVQRCRVPPPPPPPPRQPVVNIQPPSSRRRRTVTHLVCTGLDTLSRLAPFALTRVRLRKRVSTVTVISRFASVSAGR